MSEKPEVGGNCPICGYDPLYIDGGVLICVGCEQTWDENGNPTEFEAPEKED